jgi:hypothetical protein
LLQSRRERSDQLRRGRNENGTVAGANRYECSYNADRAVTDHPEAGAADELAQKQSGSGTDEQNYNGAFI